MPQARDEAGNVWETDAQGNPVRLVSQANAAPQMPTDPTFPTKAPQAAATLGKTQADTTGQTLQNQVTQATLPATIAKAQADARKAQLDAEAAAANAAGKQTPQQVQAAKGLQVDEILGALDRARGEISGFSTGFPGQILQNIGGTQAANLAGDLSTIGSGLTLDKILQMKSASSTGATGFGQLSEKEGALLRDSVAPLAQHLSADKLRQSLDQVELHYRRLRAIQDGQDPNKPDVQKAYGITPALLGAAAGKADGNPPAVTPGGNPPPTPFESDPGGNNAVATGATRKEFDASTASGINKLIQTGRPYGEVAAFAKMQGYPAPSMQQYTAAINWQKQHPNAPYDAANPTREVPVSVGQRFAASPAGAAAVGFSNGAALGLDSLVAPDTYRAITDINPGSAALGDIAGGVTGTGMLGKGLGMMGRTIGNPLVGKALANPLTANLAYGTIYGGTQGGPGGAVVGGLGALGGSAAGYALGRAAPRLFNGRAINAAEEAVPTVPQLKTRANYLYQRAESNGLTAAPQDTQGLADNMTGILTGEGRLGPTGRLSDVNPKVKDAFQLIQDYAGQPMTPTQLQTVRGVLADGLSSPDASERRIAGMMLKNFDQWSADKVPGLDQARATASRYLQAQEIGKAQDLADANASMFSGSGKENALRTQFRGIDRNAIKYGSSYSEPLLDAVENVSRGTTGSNIARGLGRLAPTGVVSAGFGGGVPFMIGNAIGGPALGGALAGGTMALGMFGRKVATNMTARNAEIANLIARDPSFASTLNSLVDQASRRATRIGAGVAAPLAVIPLSQ